MVVLLSMALSVSRRLLRSFGSVLASGRCDSPSSLYPSLHASLGEDVHTFVVSFLLFDLYDRNILWHCKILIFFYLYFGPWTDLCGLVPGVVSPEELSAVSKVLLHHIYYQMNQCSMFMYMVIYWMLSFLWKHSNELILYCISI